MGGFVTSKASNQAYLSGFDRIFGKQVEKPYMFNARAGVQGTRAITFEEAWDMLLATYGQTEAEQVLEMLTEKRALAVSVINGLICLKDD